MRRTDSLKSLEHRKYIDVPLAVHYSIKCLFSLSCSAIFRHQAELHFGIDFLYRNLFQMKRNESKVKQRWRVVRLIIQALLSFSWTSSTPRSALTKRLCLNSIWPSDKSTFQHHLSVAAPFCNRPSKSFISYHQIFFFCFSETQFISADNAPKKCWRVFRELLNRENIFYGFFPTH